MSDSGTQSKNDGIYTVRNALAGDTVFLPASNKKLTYADAQLTKAILTCGGKQLGPELTEQYFSHVFTSVTSPGSSESWPSPKPAGLPLSAIEPDPDTKTWTLSYEISAPDNTLGAAAGTVPVDRRVDTILEFRYNVDQVNGAAWYALAIWYLPDVGILPVGVTQEPNVVVQIGDAPAVHVS